MRFPLLLLFVIPLLAQTPVNNDSLRNAQYVVAGGTANALTGTTLTGFPGAYAAGQAVIVLAQSDNTGTATLNINALGPRTIQKNVAGTMTNLAAGNIQAGGRYILVNGATTWEILNFTPVTGDLPGIGGAVTSVFTRSGAVVAFPGDYSASQVTNAADTTAAYANPTWITSLAYGKLTGVPATFAPSAHVHAAADVTTGVMAVARLGTGTPSASNFLRGDGSWQAPVPAAHVHAGADITTGTVAVARLGSGSPSTANFLRGDGTWTAVPASGVQTNIVNTFTRGQIIDGTANEIQLDVQGNATQTTPIFRVATSTGTVLIQANQDGSVDLASGTGPMTLTRVAAPANPAAGLTNLWAESGANSGLWTKDSAGVTARNAVPITADGSFVTGFGSNGVFTRTAILRTMNATLKTLNETHCTDAVDSGTIKNWSLHVDAGTATVRVWKNTSATANPTSANSITATGLVLSTGTRIKDVTPAGEISDLTVAQNDNYCFTLFAVATATVVVVKVEYSAP